MELVDTHCHLDFDAYDADRDAVLERARRDGVNRIVNPAVDVATGQAALGLVARYDGVYAAVGLHPNSANAFSPEVMAVLRELAGHEGVVAIGEIGLDYYRDYTPRSTQRRAFEAQLELAAEMCLPVIIHSREAMDDVLGMLSEWGESLPDELVGRAGVLHAFSGDEDAARMAISIGFYIGIGGPVTYKNAHMLRQVVAGLPADRIVLETDGPFLTPHPHRGKRNEPAYVRLIAERVAEIRGVSPKEIALQTTANAAKLFGWALG